MRLEYSPTEGRFGLRSR